MGERSNTNMDGLMRADTDVDHGAAIYSIETTQKLSLELGIRNVYGLPPPFFQPRFDMSVSLQVSNIVLDAMVFRSTTNRLL
jgi:hypothetical protein